MWLACGITYVKAKEHPDVLVQDQALTTWESEGNEANCGK